MNQEFTVTFTYEDGRVYHERGVSLRTLDALMRHYWQAATVEAWQVNDGRTLLLYDKDAVDPWGSHKKED